MLHTKILPRRSFLGLLSTVLLKAQKETPAEAHSRRYRAHATILLLSFPILTRKDVGFGYAAVEQLSSPRRSVTALQFAGGSDPQRARGLNRIGMMQESITREGSGPPEIEYFGVMTSSTEESYDQARAALQKGSTAGLYTAAQARITKARSSSSLHRLQFEHAYDWNSRSDFLTRAKAEVASNRHCIRRDESVPAGTTFLVAMREAILNPAGQTSAEYFYNSQRYRLTSRREHDARMGEQFQRPGNVDRLSGVIQNLATGKKTQFRVWVDRKDPSGLPLRMEYQARSFLRLVFEGVPPTG